MRGSQVRPQSLPPRGKGDNEGSALGVELRHVPALPLTPVRGTDREQPGPAPDCVPANHPTSQRSPRLKSKHSASPLRKSLRTISVFTNSEKTSQATLHFSVCHLEVSNPHPQTYVFCGENRIQGHAEGPGVAPHPVRALCWWPGVAGGLGLCHSRGPPGYQELNHTPVPRAEFTETRERTSSSLPGRGWSREGLDRKVTVTGTHAPAYTQLSPRV